MPTYVYECAKCGDEFELYQSFSEEPLKKHPGAAARSPRCFQPVGHRAQGLGLLQERQPELAPSGSNGRDAAKSEASSEPRVVGQIGLEVGELVVVRQRVDRRPEVGLEESTADVEVRPKKSSSPSTSTVNVSVALP